MRPGHLRIAAAPRTLWLLGGFLAVLLSTAPLTAFAANEEKYGIVLRGDGYALGQFDNAGNFQRLTEAPAGPASARAWPISAFRLEPGRANSILEDPSLRATATPIEGRPGFVFSSENDFQRFLEKATDGRKTVVNPGGVLMGPKFGPDGTTIEKRARTFGLGSAAFGSSKPGVFSLDTLGNVFLALIDYLLTLIMWVLGILLSVAGMFTDFMLSMTRLAGSEVVRDLWTVTRDALNFVFILSLLAIAFSTIAGIESYGMRQLLPRLLVAALLVNFSLAIAGAFLQTANVLTDQAVQQLRQPPGKCELLGGERGGTGTSVTRQRGTGTSITCALANAAAISDQYKFGPSKILSALGFAEIGSFGPNRIAELGTRVKIDAFFKDNVGAVISSAIAVFFIALFCVALISLALMLGVRVAVLALLLILAPVPYAFSIIPRASQWAEKWWSTFIQYTFFLPAVVFFLVIAVRLQEFAGQGRGIGRNFGGITETLGVASDSETGNVLLSMFDAFFVSAFIIVAIVVAKTMGIYGASAAIGFARRTTAFGPRLAGAAIWTRTGKPFLAAREEAQKAVTRERRVGFFGRLGARTAAPFQPRFAARQQLREVDEAHKDFKARGADKTETLKAVTRGGVLGAAAARYGLEKDFFDTPAEFAAALQAARGGDKETIRKAYEKTRPAYALSGEDQATVEAARTTPAAAMAVKMGLRRNAENARSAFRKVKDEDLPKLGHELTLAIEAATAALRAGRPEERPLELPTNRLRAISERVPQAQGALDSYIATLRTTPDYTAAMERQLRRAGVIP